MRPRGGYAIKRPPPLLIQLPLPRQTIEKKEDDSPITPGSIHSDPNWTIEGYLEGRRLQAEYFKEVFKEQEEDPYYSSDNEDYEEDVYEDDE